MRRSIGALVGVAASITVACATETDCEGYCGTLVVLNSADPATVFQPRTSVIDEQPLVEQLFVRLAELTPELETAGDSGLVPELAARWIREDDVTLVFELNPDARWHDGHPVTAEDVVFTYEIYRDPEVSATSAVLVERIESVTARDDHTVAVRYTMPYLEQLYDVAHHLFILPKHLLDTIPRGDIATHPLMTQHPIGAGPYRLESWGDDGTIELVADTNFFLGRPGIRRIVFRTVSDFGAKLTALAAGDGDFVEFLGGLPAIERIEQSSSARVIPYASPVYNYLGFNFRSPADTSQPHPLFSDIRVRRALSLLVDRTNVNEAVTGGRGKVARSPMVPMIHLTNVDIPAYEPDTARAMELLREAGWMDSNGDGVLDQNSKPFAFEMLYPSTSGVRQTTAIALEEMFRNAGLDVDVNAVDFPTYTARQASGEFDALINSQFTSPSPSSVKTSWITGGTYNWGRYANPEFDAAVQRFENATSPADREQALEDAFTTMYEDAPAVWLYYLNMNAGVHRRFENVSIRPDSWSVTLWQWQIRDGEWIPRDLVGN